MIGLLILSVLFVLSVVSVVFGVDSRDGFADRGSPMYPVSIH
jgi:hypothetical protein